MKKNAIILAAGQGSRMKSKKAKVLFEILDKPMLRCVYDHLINAEVTNIIPVIHPSRKNVLDVLPENVVYAEQNETLGTGHAVKQARNLLCDQDGITIVVAGDQPLINDHEIKNLIDYHVSNDCDMTMMTAILDNPTGYGRVVKNGFQVDRIVEQKDLENGQYDIKEVNISTYCFNNKLLFKHIEELENKNAQKEFYVTDLVEIFNNHDLKVGSVPISNRDFSIGINDLKMLAKANKIMRDYVNDIHLENGVEIIDPSNTYIGYDVEIDSDVVIFPNTIISGKSKVGKGSIIKSSYIYDSIIGENVEVGPYAHLRNNAVVGDGCRIGNFVEVKKSTLSSGVKAAHLTYLGDATIGKNTNIGCGTITVNYDGVNKYQTVIGENAFIGSNVNLIAPVEIGNNALIAAGSTVAIDKVNDNALVVARSREYIKENYKK